MPTRRGLLAGSLALAAAAPAPVPFPKLEASLPPTPAAPQTGPGLGAIAAAHGRVYGAAVANNLLTADPRLSALADAECGLMMTDYEAKWGVIEPVQGQFNFATLDALLAWAEAHRKPVRGHGLVWFKEVPDWLAPAIAASPKQAYAILSHHLATVLDHTKGVIREWDVLNEVVADPPGSDVPQANGELRDCAWLRSLGPGYISLALRLCRDYGPNLVLALNEYGTEENAPHHIEKRRRLLALVRSLRQANVPLDTVGLQGHMQLVQPFSGPAFTQFCRDLRAEGVTLVVTEMDVRESWQGPTLLPDRDRVVADRVRAFMDAAIDGGIETFITWGLCDRYSWLATDDSVRRHDGLVHRGLPFDDDYDRKPYWQAMAEAFRRPA